MSDNLDILLVEDSRHDAELLEALVRATWPQAALTVVSNGPDFAAALSAATPDVILSDVNLPGYDGREALGHARVVAPQVPFIFISGTIGEDNAVELLKQGADDYVSKDRFSERLPLVLERALRDKQRMETLRRDESQASAALQESERQYQTLFERIDEGFCVIEFLDGPHGPLSDYIHIAANPAYHAHAGIANVVGQKVREMVGAEAEGWVQTYREVLLTGRPIRFERELVATGRFLALSAFRIDPPERRQVAVLFQDVTERHRAVLALQELNESLERRVAAEVAERMRTEEVLRQSQKMEAIGQLTGGIAHDFNNILATIGNSLQLLRMRMAQGRTEGTERYIGMGEDSVKRAAALTHRLLAFSRRQTLDPKPLDVNRLVRGMEDMIRRTVGPQIEVEVVGAGGLWITRVDASQLENSLLNLCINARDAMPEGGRLTIETANKWLDEHASSERELPPGQYVSLCVTDSGVGMAPEIIERIFDPFFTTKPIGLGTGLGLSMVYGFVRQSGGQVRVYSEVGRGTTMCLYLPRHFSEADDGAAPAPPPMEAGDGETILVVEDEWGVRATMEEVLTEAGYRVISADSSGAAMKLLATDTEIDLLITDVGLPGGMNGRQVADAARATRPKMAVLFVTGYADNAAVGNGHLEPGMAVLTKPFDLGSLTSRVKTLLDQR